MRLLVLALAAAAVVSGLGAAPAPALPDPEANLVEELVVQARVGGPAWWRVEDGDTTVFILGVPDSPLPPGAKWNTALLDKRLTGANVLISRPVMQIGIGDIGTLLKLRKALKTKKMEESLPPDLRARFVAARTRLGRPAGRYADWSPILAGQRLVQDSRGGGKWANVDTLVEKAAKKRKVKVRRAATYDGAPFLKKAMTGLTPAVQNHCMKLALDDVESAGKLAPAGHAWTRGDVAGAVLAPRSFDRCLLELNGGVDVWRRSREDQVNAIAAAMAKPGHAVALVNLRTLVAEDGVVQRLRAKGFKVTGP
jgi:hypothetical protein